MEMEKVTRKRECSKHQSMRRMSDADVSNKHYRRYVPLTRRN